MFRFFLLEVSLPSEMFCFWNTCGKRRSEVSSNDSFNAEITSVTICGFVGYPTIWIWFCMCMWMCVCVWDKEREREREREIEREREWKCVWLSLRAFFWITQYWSPDKGTLRKAQLVKRSTELSKSLDVRKNVSRRKPEGHALAVERTDSWKVCFCWFCFSRGVYFR